MNKNLKRTLSRLMAVQIFHQNEFLNNEKTVDEIKQEMMENYLIDPADDLSSYRDKIDNVFLDNLLSGIALDDKKIDADISEFLKAGWKIENLEGITAQVLRCGAFELKYVKNIPPKIVIAEYVDIAAAFLDRKQLTFVNALLEKLARKFRAEEF